MSMMESSILCANWLSPEVVCAVRPQGSVTGELFTASYLNNLAQNLPESQGESISLLLQQTVPLLSTLQPDLHLGQGPVYLTQ